MKKIKALLFTTLFTTSAGVMAVPLSGNIIFAGGVQTNNTSVLDATIFTFTTVTALVADGNFSTLTGTIIPFTPLNMGSPFGSLWTSSSGFTYNLTRIDHDETHSGSARHIIGMGTVTDGVTSSPMSWDLTTQIPGAGSPATYSFSAASSASVPAPLALALLVPGLIAIGLSRRFHKA